MQEMHMAYKAKLAEVMSLQSKCASGVKHQRYRYSVLYMYVASCHRWYEPWYEQYA